MGRLSRLKYFLNKKQLLNSIFIDAQSIDVIAELNKLEEIYTNLNINIYNLHDLEFILHNFSVGKLIITDFDLCNDTHQKIIIETIKLKLNKIPIILSMDMGKFKPFYTQTHLPKEVLDRLNIFVLD